MLKSKKYSIYGAEGDHVALETDIGHLRYWCKKVPLFFGFEDGTLVRVMPKPYWKIEVLNKGSFEVTHTEKPVEHVGSLTDMVMLHQAEEKDPPKWVMVGYDAITKDNEVMYLDVLPHEKKPSEE